MPAVPAGPGTQRTYDIRHEPRRAQARDEGERLRRENMAYADAAFMCENAYLYCASAGLAAVVRASIDSERLAKTLSLSADQRPLLAQTIGYPKE